MVVPDPWAHPLELSSHFSAVPSLLAEKAGGPIWGVQE